MKDRKQWMIRRADIVRYDDTIRTENRTAFRLMAGTGAALSAVNLVAQILVTQFTMPIFRSSLLLAYFVMLLFIDRVILPADRKVPTWSLYLVQAPVMAISILLGTVWDPQNAATTILLFMLATPVFIVDHPNRSLGIMAGWCAVFLLMSRCFKDEAMFRMDAMDITEFFVAATAVTYVVMRIRLRSLENLEETRFHMTHDRKTGCLNGYALEAKLDDYFGKPLVVLIGSIDQLTMYTDFYGKAVGDAIQEHFTHVLMDKYGKDCTYTNGSGEILCLMQDIGTAECLERAAECRKETHAFARGRVKIAVTFAMGCVTGQPENQRDLDEMIQMAVVFAHRARNTGRDQNWSGAYTQAAFRKAVAEGTTSTRYAMSYETSQLTGLPGLSYFTARTDEMILNVLDPKMHPVIGYFKLTRLREYNDEYGYAQGDRLIVDTAHALQQAFTNRYLCHITAGQFCVLCYRTEVEPAIEKMVLWMAKCRPDFTVTGKTGFAEITGSETASELIDRARIAQRSILNRTGTDYCFYDEELDAEQRFRQYIVNHLDEAIEKEWLEVYYQPIVRVSSGQICNEEALSRWNDPKNGFLMPFRFIPPLEEQGLMYKVNLYVVDRVLKDFRRREEAGLNVVPVSVNLSRKDFLQCDMVKEISGRVDKAGYSRRMIRIEITESAFIGDQEMIGREVRRFREAGFHVWMDDFGSEYSTLNLLQEVDFDLIKIDMKFIRNLTPGEKNYVIVSNMIRMLKEMGIRSLMEGVETEEQRQTLEALGCEKLQGYLFSKPSPLDYIIEKMTETTNHVRYEAGTDRKG